jgi:catechol 2,3-dioxygenase-like lactoylglutathione lyase family enzyme
MLLRFSLTLGALIALSGGIEAQEVTTPAADFSVMGMSFVAIRVPDAAEAAEWYRTALRLEQVNHLEADDGRYSIYILSGAGLTVELIRVRGAAPSPLEPQLGLFKSGLFVDNIDAAFAWLRQKGADTDDSIFFDEALNVRSFVFRDPYGNRLQVLQRCDPECDGRPLAFSSRPLLADRPCSRIARRLGVPPPELAALDCAENR